MICNNPDLESAFNSVEINDVAAAANNKLKKDKNVSLPVKKEKKAKTATMDKTISAKSTDKLVSLAIKITN
jgi:hypothetical protein